MKLVLRTVEESDLEWLLTHRNNPLLNVNFNQPMPLSYEDQLAWYKTQVLGRKAYAYIAELNGTKVGYGALQNINWITRSAEISHFVTHEFDSATFGYMINDILVHMAFFNLNLHKVHSICFEFNNILKELERIGFKKEGTIKDHCYKNGRYFDSYYISVLKDEYERLFKGL